MRFFRIIRQALINDNKFRKYLTYAIGEIILVVIGILIALAINNINQKNTIRDKEITYLKGLRDEFQTSKIKLVELVKVNRSNYDGARQLVSFIGSDSIPSEEEFSKLVFNTLAYDIAFNPNNSLLNEMINSGSLKDISNNLLRIRLATWISTIDDIARQEMDLEIQREKLVDIFRGDDYSIRTAFDLADTTNNHLGLSANKNYKSNLSLLGSTAFENNLILFILSAKATEENHYQPLLHELDRIIELIDHELKD